MNVNFKYRTWGACKIDPLRRIKLEVPGWAGEKTYNTGQPHHCKPFIDGSTYGYELIYPFDTEVRVRCDNDEGISQFLSDDTKEWDNLPCGMPMANFAPNHFGFTSSLDIQTEPGWGTMILPHPRYYTDRTGSVPLPVGGIIASDIWPKIFFLAFRAPLKGRDYVFKKGEGIAQFIFVPKEIEYKCEQMNEKEKAKRSKGEKALREYSHRIFTKKWLDENNHTFDNKYKILCQMQKEKTPEEILNYLCNIVDEEERKVKAKEEEVRKNFRYKFVKPKKKEGK